MDLSLRFVKRGASSRWSFHPNSAWSRIETTAIENLHPYLDLNVYESGVLFER